MKWWGNENKSELLQKRMMPVGVSEFHAWADRIIEGAMLPATKESQKFALANMIVTELKPTDDCESDLYFIKRLRKNAANNIAIHVRDQLKAEAELKKQKALEEAKQNQSAAGAPTGTDGKEVLEKQ